MRAIRGIEVAMHVQTQYILIDVLPGGSWITTVPGIFIYILAISRALVEPPEVRITPTQREGVATLVTATAMPQSPGDPFSRWSRDDFRPRFSSYFERTEGVTLPLPLSLQISKVGL